MREKHLFNDSWKFYYGEIGMPPKTVKKAAAIGGYTSVLNTEKGDIVPLGAGGHHFLNLISGGNEKLGMKILANTKLDATLEGWQDVTLPHDWKTELSYEENNPALLMSGSKPDGVAYYRKTFSLGEELKDKHISIHFDGVVRSASVWFNGCFLGDHFSGYTSFSYNLSDMAHYGEEGDNVILVRVDTTTGPEGWWYEGAGIYRNVYLEIKDKVHIDQWGVNISTKEINDNKAILEAEITIKNDSYDKAYVYPTIEIDGLIEKYTEVALEPLECKTVKKEISIENPRLWSVDEPNLYNANIELNIDDILIDSCNTRFGIRKVKYTTEGLFINDKYVEIKGVCEHQDFVGVGTALSKDIVRFKLEKLKEMGGNAYRSAHHAASPELLDLCDELGIIVMEEYRVLESSEHKLSELKEMVLRDRNHPSIIFWSLCNEEIIGSTKMAERMARRIAMTIRNLDSERILVSAELLSLEGIISEEYKGIFDVIGVNYPESPVMGEGLNNIKKRYPDQPLMSTENASYFSTRGIYKDNWDLCHTNNMGSCFSMFGKDPLPKGAPGAGGTAHPEQVMDFFESHKFMGGSFLWTQMDYCGEPSPFEWPAISSQFGIMDTCGFPKDYFYYYKSKWNSEPMVYAMPHWNLNDIELEETEVRVFSNCEEVELFINDISQGRKVAGKHSTSWDVKFEAGELKVIGYNDNKVVAEYVKHTSGVASELKLRRMDSKEDNINSGDTILVEVYAVDENGIEVPTADNLVEIIVEGEGRLLGVGNGNPADHTLHKSNIRALFSGKLAAVIQCGENSGTLKIKAISNNIKSHSIDINIK